jgi:hypothetical protein
VRQAGGCIKVSGLPQDRAGLNGRYRREGSAGGRAAYKNQKGQHLFWHPEADEWLLSSIPYDPAEKTCVAFIGARGGPVPAGARAWRVFTGGEWVDRELTVREEDAPAGWECEVDGTWLAYPGAFLERVHASTRQALVKASPH